jgi:hypothetical protein
VHRHACHRRPVTARAGARAARRSVGPSAPPSPRRGGDDGRTAQLRGCRYRVVYKIGSRLGQSRLRRASTGLSDDPPRSRRATSTSPCTCSSMPQLPSRFCIFACSLAPWVTTSNQHAFPDVHLYTRRTDRPRGNASHVIVQVIGRKHRPCRRTRNEYSSSDPPACRRGTAESARTRHS